MSATKISPQLEQAINLRIQQITDEDAHIKDFIRSISLSSNAVGTDDGKQFGTSIPTFFGSIDTFITNPSNVGVGIIARMIETDPTVLSAVQFKSLMMLSKIGEYQHTDKKIEDFVRRFITRMRGGWKASLEAQSSSGGYGFSVTEIIWGLNSKNEKVPFKLRTYHPSTLCFEVDQYGEVTDSGIIQFTIQNSQITNPNTLFPYFQHGFQVKNPFETPTDRLLPYRMPFLNNYGLVRIPKNKVIHHVQNSMLSFGSPYGKTSVRTAHLAWQLKVFFLKQMGIAGKRQAAPLLWGTAPMNQNKVEVEMPDGTKILKSPIQSLTDILSKREGDDAIVTGPEGAGYKLEALAAQMDLKQYLEVLNWIDVQIFRGFLLPSLVMTDGSAGSRSLGDKHFQVVDRIAEDDATTFSSTVVDQLVRPAIDMNFGEQDDYGHFAQRPQSIEERERLANMFVSLSNGGFVRPYDKIDGDFVRSALHLPEQDESFYAQSMPNFDPLNPDDALKPGDPGYTEDFTDRVNQRTQGDQDQSDNSNDPKKKSKNASSTGEDNPSEEQQLESKSDSAFNGAQVTAVVTVVTSVATGEIPHQTGIEILKSMFGFDDEQAKRLLPSDITKNVSKQSDDKPKADKEKK
jgi:hypothetical protein